MLSMSNERRKEGRKEHLEQRNYSIRNTDPSFSSNFAERNIFFFFFTIDFIHLQISCSATSNGVRSERDSSMIKRIIRHTIDERTIEILKSNIRLIFRNVCSRARERIDSTPVLNLGLTRGSTSARFDTKQGHVREHKMAFALLTVRPTSGCRTSA